MPTIGAALTITSNGVSRDGSGRLSYVTEYEGTYAAIEALRLAQSSHANSGNSYKTDYTDPPRYKISISYKFGDNEYAYKWDIPGNEVQKDLLDHENAAEFPKGLIRGIIDATNVSRATSAELNSIVTNAAAKEGLTATDPMTLAALEILELKLRGQGHYWDANHTARLKEYIGANSNVQQIPDFGAGAIYSTAQLIVEAAANNTPLPQRYITKFQGIPIKTVTGGRSDKYLWGWLKKVSNEEEQSGAVIQVSTDWVLDLWPLATYDILV